MKKRTINILRAKKTGKHQSSKAVFQREKKRGNSEKNGKEGKEKQNRQERLFLLLSVLLSVHKIVIFFAMSIFCCCFFRIGLCFRQ